MNYSKMKKGSLILVMSFIIFFGANINLKAEEYDDYSVDIDQTSNIDVVDYSDTGDHKVKATHNADAAKINVSGYEDPKKEQADAGEQELKVSSPNKSDEVKTYKLERNGGLKSVSGKEKESTSLNTIDVKDGQIIGTNYGIVETLGGYDKIQYMYPTTEDAYNGTNGVDISGGGFDGAYLGTEKYNDEYYAHIYISGYEGYMDINDVQIIPSALIQSQSYYTNSNGEWVFNEAVSPLTSDQYTQMTVGSAPDWSSEGEQYYTVDDEHYFTTNVYQSGVTTVGSSSSSITYFQNLPMRSTADYTGSQYKSYLASVGHSNSEYYGSTDAFVKAQDTYYMNSMMLFSLANHEGAYGTSYYSQACNNFFGRGAIDSDPDQACENYGFTTPTDGILAQAAFMTQNYADITWAYYHGSEFGDKSHGMNVSYASDPNWGKANASMMYSVDQYLGGHEENKYRIYEIKNSEPLYTSSSLSSKVRLKPLGSAEENYVIPRNNGADPRVLVTDETSNAFEVQLPTPKNVKGESYCTWTNANRGSYPSFDGYLGGAGTAYANPVGKNVGNFACDYSSWGSQQAWYPKHDSAGAQTYNVVSSAAATTPGHETEEKTTTHKDYCSNGKLKTTIQQTTSGGKLVDKITTEYDCSTGKKTDYIHEEWSIKGHKTYYRHIMYAEAGYHTYDRQARYDGNNGKMLEDHMYKYYSDGHKRDFYDKTYNKKTYKEVDYVRTQWNDAGYTNYYRHIEHESDGSILYNRQIHKDSKAHYLDDLQTFYYSNGHKKDEIAKEYYPDNHKIEDYVHRSWSSKGYETYYRHIMYAKAGYHTYDRQARYDGSNGKMLEDHMYKYYSDGHKRDFYDKTYNKKTYKEVDYVRTQWNDAGYTNYYRHIEHESDGSILYNRQIHKDSKAHYLDDVQGYYYSNGKLKDQKKYQYDPKTHKEIDYLHEQWYSNGVKKYYRHIMHYSDGTIRFDRKVTYDSKGHVTSDSQKSYNSNGKLKGQLL